MNASRHIREIFKILIVSLLLMFVSPASYADSQSSLALLDGEILFGTGDFELTPEGKRSLTSLINRLDRFDQILSIRIIGHTDNTGDARVNQWLSERRAKWIKAQFVSGYPGTHILTIGAGESAPLVSNDTPQGRARNRRVEIQIIATGKSPL